MLRHLHIRNLAVVADASIDFDEGLNVLSGATGAGKSIVVDSLALIAGGRARADLIRAGEETLTISALFEAPQHPGRLVLEEAGVELGGGEMVVRREISRQGRNRVFIDDRPVTLRLLADLAPFILRIHTQREELGLASPELQRFWIDRSGGDEAVALLDATRRHWDAWKALDERWHRLVGDERLRLERIDLLRFQRQEIEAAGLERGEERELVERRDALRHREAITRCLGESFTLLFDAEGSALEAVARSAKLLAEIEDWEPGASAWQAELEGARLSIEEVAQAVRDRLDALPEDVGQLDEVESRLAIIERLGRKYGDGTDEILDGLEAIRAELDELEASEESRDSLAAEREEALARYEAAARELSEARLRWGRELVGRIQRELADLAMGQARLEVRLDPVASDASPLRLEGEGVAFGPEGYDRVSIELQANPGGESGPLARVASGGELSRVYLALQLAVGEMAASRPTLIFDEVDAGIGGSEAAALGYKLRRLSEGGQILAVTHLPQVASCGHVHFRVLKTTSEDETFVEVERLGRERRVEEIARMLSGEEITQRALSNAEELIEAGGVGT